MEMDTEENGARMPLRDADLRHAATDHEVRPGDPLWRLLEELQRARDRERAGLEFRTGARR